MHFSEGFQCGSRASEGSKAGMLHVVCMSVTARARGQAWVLPVADGMRREQESELWWWGTGHSLARPVVGSVRQRSHVGH